jgi:protein-tyrosine sulfotransferase
MSSNHIDNGIIILGSPRSGTTLLRRLLDAHPDLSCPGESFLFKSCASFFDADKISHGFDYGVLSALEGLGFSQEETVERLRDFATSFYKDIAQKNGKKYWVAKTAIDCFYMDTIEAMFADHAKFICVTRHGMDVVCSMEEFVKDLQSYITELHAYLVEYPQPLEAFAHAWADITTDIHDFAERYSAHCLHVKYEDLTENPDAELARITEFLGIEKSPKQAAEILGQKSVDGIGDWKSYKKTKVEKTSINRWQEQLPHAAMQTLAPIVNPVLSLAGYDPIEEESEEDAQRRQEIAMMMMQAKGE